MVPAPCPPSPDRMTGPVAAGRGVTGAAHLGDDGGVIDIAAVLPAVQARLLLQRLQLHVGAGSQPQRREVGERGQAVAAAAARLLPPAPQLQRDAGVAPLLAQVGPAGHGAPVLGRAGHEHDGEAVEAVGDDAGAEQEEDEALEAAPFAQESGGRVVVAHGERGARRVPRTGRSARRCGRLRPGPARPPRGGSCWHGGPGRRGPRGQCQPRAVPAPPPRGIPGALPGHRSCSAAGSELSLGGVSRFFPSICPGSRSRSGPGGAGAGTGRAGPGGCGISARGARRWLGRPQPSPSPESLLPPEPKPGCLSPVLLLQDGGTARYHPRGSGAPPGISSWTGSGNSERSAGAAPAAGLPPRASHERQRRQ